MNYVIKKTIKILIIVFILDFIPIKFASTKDYIETNHYSTHSIYICERVEITGISWIADSIHNKESCEFTGISGVLPQKSLSSSCLRAHNLYIFKGKRSIINNDLAFPHTLSNRSELYILKSEQWRILYPISRYGIRNVYVPKLYLTIYDFKFGNIIAVVISFFIVFKRTSHTGDGKSHTVVGSAYELCRLITKAAVFYTAAFDFIRNQLLYRSSSI